MAKITIGLTGGIGSGKTTVSNLFQKLGVEIIDADVVAREVVAPKSHTLKLITERFGPTILTSEDQLDRAQLRTIIFSNTEEKSWLNALLHPIIRQEIQQKVRISKGNYCILSAPLLIENQLHKLVDRVLVVDVSEEIQLSRTLQRDSSNQQEIKAIIKSQISRNDRLKAADDIIENQSPDLTLLNKRVEELNQQYEKLSQ